MAWVKVDDRLPHHQKWRELADDPRGYMDALALWLCAMCHCNTHETDGFVDFSTAKSLGKLGVRRTKTVWELLVKCGFATAVEGGYEIANYLEYQPSRSELDDKRERAKKRMRRVRGERSREQPAKLPESSPNPDPGPVPDIVVVVGGDPQNDDRTLTAGEVGRAVEVAWSWPIPPKWRPQLSELCPVSPAELHAADLAVRRVVEQDGGKPNPGLLIRKLQAQRREKAKPAPVGGSPPRQHRFDPQTQSRIDEWWHTYGEPHPEFLDARPGPGASDRARNAAMVWGDDRAAVVGLPVAKAQDRTG